MRLLEFQAKRLLSRYGIPIPKSVLVRSPDDLRNLSSFPVVLKSQVPVGGRGKAGAIRLAAQPEEATAITTELLNSSVKGYPVSAVLIEEQVEIKQELYLAILIDRLASQPLIMASATGGVDIEEMARKSPEKIVSKHLNHFVGLPDYIVRYLAEHIGLKKPEDFRRIVNQVYQIFRNYDATLVEVNPLALTPNGLVALDAKILLDDKAAYRQQDLFTKLQEEQKGSAKSERTSAEQLAAEKGVTYVTLGGEVGMISDGAGSGMLTLDLIQDAGGHAANFCELGGLAGAESMRQALEVVHANPRVKVILIGLIGGLTRMDEMADGILTYLEQHKKSRPLVVRMCGTKEEIGKAKLHMVGIEAVDDLEMAVNTAVKLVREPS